MPTPPPLQTATLDHLQRHPPFGQMDRADLLWMIERLQLAYFGQGEILLSPADGPPPAFRIIKQGVVVGVDAETGTEPAWLELGEGECFPFGALLSRRPVTTCYRAETDTFCFELAANDFHVLCARSAAFSAFCTQRLARLLEQSRHAIQHDYADSDSEPPPLTRPLSEVMRANPLTCRADTPLRDALALMNQHHIGSMIAVDERHHALGIFTLKDLLPRVVLPGISLDVPFKAVMTPEPFALPPHAFAHDAALAMARHGFRHVLVEDAGKLIGLISEKDLFALQRVGLRQLSETLRVATDLPTLQACARDIHQLAHNMMAQGVGAGEVAQLISTLNDILTARVIELALAERPCPHDFCWLALGSEGRFEQTLNTDQDNGILFDLQPGEDAASVRAALLPLARRINEMLDQCGFPLCKGEVMASNPKWCLSLAEWRATFERWIDQGDPEALLNASIFFDFRPLYGDLPLAAELRGWLSTAAPKNHRFLHQMAANALRNRPPLGTLRDFVTRDDDTLDLKLNGTTPFVDAARILNLAAGGQATSTTARLRELVSRGILSTVDGEGYIDAFLFIQLLRLRLHESQAKAGQAMTNLANPAQLNTLDRRILREAFRQAKKLQTRLALDYRV